MFVSYIDLLPSTAFGAELRWCPGHIGVGLAKKPSTPRSRAILRGMTKAKRSFIEWWWDNAMWLVPLTYTVAGVSGWWLAKMANR